MSQMPDKIWLHKDTKYNTGDIVCGYQYDFVQGIEDEGGIENFVEYVPVDAFIEKACEFINKANLYLYHCISEECDLVDTDKMIEDFKNYIKGNKV